MRPGGRWRFNTGYGVVEGEFREVEPPARLVQTFQNHLQTLEFEDLGERTKLTQTMRFATTEERDTTMQYGVEEGAKGGFVRVDAVLQRLAAQGCPRNAKAREPLAQFPGFDADVTSHIRRAHVKWEPSDEFPSAGGRSCDTQTQEERCPPWRRSSTSARSAGSA